MHVLLVTDPPPPPSPLSLSHTHTHMLALNLCYGLCGKHRLRVNLSAHHVPSNPQHTHPLPPPPCPRAHVSGSRRGLLFDVGAGAWGVDGTSSQAYLTSQMLGQCLQLEGVFVWDAREPSTQVRKSAWKEVMSWAFCYVHCVQN
jgi:hypothetical protein